MRRLNGKRSLSLALAGLFLLGCAGMDDQPLPADAQGQVYFQSFEIDPSRDYILGRIVNDSPYTLTSCRIAINIYHEDPTEGDALFLTEVQPGDSLRKSSPDISEKLFMRETLKPGYSTEIYFELPMKHLSGQAVYTREIIELKGRSAAQ
ncbi:MAG: hypothetical protein K9M49_00545 [Candidatus Marinimicrobia bacterium]|nr:hypothetical protein [Candidatus Neomarinimicrobiota bacterium]MCF7903616.1 hypothetical protein [Candidatus Neomarinimicrobiota bacterium]